MNSCNLGSRTASLTRLTAGACLVALVVGVLGTNQASHRANGQIADGELEKGFVELFTGNSIAGWSSTSGAPWTAGAGVLVAPQAGGVITSNFTCDDIDLRFSYRILDAGGKVNVHLRGTSGMHPSSRVILHDGPECGTIAVAQGSVVSPAATAHRASPEWNECRIVCQGPVVEVQINNMTVSKTGREEVRLGELALEATGSRVEIKSLRARSLDLRPMFKGDDLAGWEVMGQQGNPWSRNGEGGVQCSGQPGGWLSSTTEYGDFTLNFEYRLLEGGNSGIFIRAPKEGNPWEAGMEIQLLDDGSDRYTMLKEYQYTGSVYGAIPPSKRATRPGGEWNRMQIQCQGRLINVWVNGQLVVSANMDQNPKLKSRPSKGYLGLQNHSEAVEFRHVQFRHRDYADASSSGEDAFVSLFDGKSLEGWQGALNGYQPENGSLVCIKDIGGNLYTKNEYSDFVYRFEFKLEPGSNNGIGLRAPLEGDAAYVGMESQVLDDTAAEYANLKPYQYHGSIYGVAPCEQGHQKPIGEWNQEEIICHGRQVTVKLNGHVIVDVDLDRASTPQTVDGQPHPGLKREKGYLGFLGHGARIEFRGMRIRDLSQP